MKKGLLVLCMVVLSTALLFAGGSAESGAQSARQQTVYLNMGSTSSASPVYAWAVAAANAVNNAGVNIQVTVIESGAGLDNIRKIREGVFDFALAVDVPSTYQAYHGIDTFAGQQNDQLRWLLVRNIIADRIYVRKDSGVTMFSELAGRRFSPGIPGSAAANYVVQYNEILGTNINLVPMALADAVNALKENRIVGIQRSSGMFSMDAAMVEVNLTTPVTAVGFTREQADRIKQRMPYLTFLQTERGSIREIPDAGGFYESCPIAGGIATSQMSQEVGYQIVKAYYEALDEIHAAYAPSRGFDPIADYFKYASGDDVVPAHAGLVQYAVERGITVPPAFIPSEYVAR